MCKDRKQDFIVMYGQTEAAPRISYLPSAMLDHKLGSIGIPIPNGRLKIVDVDGLDVLDADVIGEIVYQGPNVMMGYAQVVSDLALPCAPNRNLSTGDLGFFDADGYFFVTGRLKRFIKVYGLRVGLDEIENWLLKSDVESAATGFDDNLLVYILDSTVNIDLLKTKIATEFKFNIRAISVSLIDGFPRSANGKIDYASLPVSIHGGGL